MVNATKPRPPVIRNVFYAFIVGGLICAFGQFLINVLISYDFNPTDASAIAASILIAIAAILTGIGVWDKIGKFAGAGAIVPITGFANSMVAAALEYKREGMIFGVGAKLFSIAGPVLVFGIVTSWLIGLLAYLFS